MGILEKVWAIDWTPTLVIATYAASLSTAVFLWNIVIYLRSGPRIKISLMRAGKAFLGELGPSEKLYTGVTVKNTGTATTTISQYGTVSYRNWFFRLIQYSAEHSIVIAQRPLQTLPFELKQGCQWEQLIPEDENYLKLLKKYRAYVYVKHVGGTVRVPIPKVKPAPVATNPVDPI